MSILIDILILLVLLVIALIIWLDFYIRYWNTIKDKIIDKKEKEDCFDVRYKTHWDKVIQDLEKLTKQ